MGTVRTIKEEKELKRFLRERKLTRAFKTHQKLKGKTVKEYTFKNYDGTSRRGKIVITSSKKGTVFRDFETLTIIGRSRKSRADAIRDIFTTTTRKDSKDIKLRGALKGKSFIANWNIKENIKHSNIQLKNTVKTSSYNTILGRLRTVETTNKVRRGKKRFGFVVIDAIYIGGNGEKRRVQARSKSHNLQNAEERSKAYDEALYYGSVVAEFTPIDIDIKDFWYEYWTDKFRSTR